MKSCIQNFCMIYHNFLDFFFKVARKGYIFVDKLYVLRHLDLHSIFTKKIIIIIIITLKLELSPSRNSLRTRTILVVMDATICQIYSGIH